MGDGVPLTAGVSLEDVGHRFGDGPWLFRGLTATLQPDHVYALIGPSGSGKSTLLSLIAGWVTPAEGHIHTAPDARTAWVFQNPHGVARRTAIDHVTLPLLAPGRSPARADRDSMELLRAFALEHIADQPFSSLSGGEAQRLMLARGIASEPDVLLIDEPTAQLDLQTRREVNAAIGALRRPGTVVVIATHDEETRAGCTDILDLRDVAA